MRPHNAEAFKATMKAEGGWRKRNRQTGAQRVCGAWLVCQSPPPLPADIQYTTVHTHKQWQTQSLRTLRNAQFVRLFARAFVTAFWGFQNAVVKGVWAWQASRGCGGQTAHCGHKKNDNKGDQKSQQLTDIQDFLRLLTSTLFSTQRSETEKGLNPTHLSVHLEPRVKAVLLRLRRYVCVQEWEVSCTMCESYWYHSAPMPNTIWILKNNETV